MQKGGMLGSDHAVFILLWNLHHKYWHSKWFSISSLEYNSRNSLIYKFLPDLLLHLYLVFNIVGLGRNIYITHPSRCYKYHYNPPTRHNQVLHLIDYQSGTPTVLHQNLHIRHINHWIQQRYTQHCKREYSSINLWKKYYLDIWN